MALNISPGDHVLDLCAAPGRFFFSIAYILYCPIVDK